MTINGKNGRVSMMMRFRAFVFTLMLVFPMFVMNTAHAVTDPIPRWVQVVSPTTLDLASISLVAPGEGWAVGGSGIMLHLHDGTWSEVPRVTTNPLHVVQMLTAEEGWAAGSDVILHYHDGAWTIEETPHPISIDALTMVSASEGWAVGGRVTLHYLNGRWDIVDPLPTTDGSDAHYMALAASSANDIWAVGFNGQIAHYDGTLWHSVSSGTTDLLYDLSIHAANDIWAVGGRFFRFQGSTATVLHWDGQKWSTVERPEVELRTGVDGNWTVGYGPWTLRVAANGSLERVWLGQNVTDVADAGDGSAWAIGSGGTLYHYGPSPSPGDPVTATPAGPQHVYFPETGHSASNGFLAYWQAFGGLAAFGYPTTEEFQEQGVTVQYFERVRFEWHPGAAPERFDVWLGLVGDEVTADRRAAGEAPFLNTTPRDQPDCNYFLSTDHNLCGGFRSYWEDFGGLAQLGYPISEEFVENGMTVQYFERARLEWHPGVAPARYDVVLGRLGADVAKIHDLIR
ncbi:MAG TPA: hypothetical protein VNE17_01960 [Nitrolancea sp.]|nr:hypothetical protein [Nitrolancea sp.]